MVVEFLKWNVKVPLDASTYFFSYNKSIKINVIKTIEIVLNLSIYFGYQKSRKFDCIDDGVDTVS